MVSAVKMAIASMMMNHCVPKPVYTSAPVASSFVDRKVCTRIGNTIEPAPITPRPAKLLIDARTLRFSLSRVDTGTIVAFAVL